MKEKREENGKKLLEDFAPHVTIPNVSISPIKFTVCLHSFVVLIKKIIKIQKIKIKHKVIMKKRKEV